MSATTPRDRTASKATVEPMLIRDMATVKRQVMRIELPGTCHFGCTYYGLGTQSMSVCRSSACTYASQPMRKRHAIISGESKELPGRRSVGACVDED